MDANGIFDIHSVKRFFPEGGGGEGERDRRARSPFIWFFVKAAPHQRSGIKFNKFEDEEYPGWWVSTMVGRPRNRTAK